MGDNETLFSLELAVNSLRIDPHTVICRMPAVAFRLLDFPSILVEQLDHVEAKQLKGTIQNTWEYEENIPPQLGELKDRHGNHEFQKGKSSLYRYKLKSLVSHLENTPLYIMIVDVWTAVPKLVAHCNVSLKEAILRIRQDVSEFGVSVPSVHGIQGKFPIFNLMGTEIGWISLGVRLLSLGGNLLPHIADASLAKKVSAAAEDANSDRNIPENLIVPHSVSVPRTLARSDHQRSKDDHQNIMVDFACQITDGTKNEAKVDFAAPKKGTQIPSKSTRLAADHIEIDDEGKYLDSMAVHQENDVFITNTHIPPPLIYNSANDVKVKSSRQYRVPEKVKFEPQSSLSPLRSVIGNNSGTVSPDVDSRRDLEVQYVIHPPEFHSSPNVRKILRRKKRAQSTVPINLMHSDAQNKEEVERTHIAEREIEAPLTDNIEHLHKLPILQALLRELSILNRRDADAVGPGLHGQDDFVSNKTSGKHRMKDRCQHLSKPQVHEELKVPKSKPTVQKVYRHKHKDCAKPPSGVPASKGWLRQQPRYGKQKKETKLKFKMTNSQKLRIQRHNPEAFRQLEEEERIAEIEFQMRAATEMQIEEAKMSKVGRKSEQRPPGPYPSENTLPSPEAYLSTEIARHLDHEQIDVEDLEADDVFKRGMETFKIPTEEPVDENQVKEVSDEDPSVYHRVDEKDASGSDKSVRSISVHLPTASVQEYEDDEEESSSDESQQEGPKPVSVPGFPEDLQEDERPREPATPAPGYSDDFDESYRYVSTGEQELANIQSSIASGASSYAPQDHSVEHSDSHHSNASSYKTAESVQSAKSYKAVEDQPSRIVDPSYVVNPPSKSSSSSASSRHPPSILSIPQPQMSANSPIPIARRSSAKSAIFSQPPQPKPRLSLDQTSSISNASVLAPGLTLSNTLESSEVNTFDLKPDLSEDEEQNDAYSDDFESDN